MIALVRGITASGAALLAASFFAYPHYHNSPVGRFLWAAEEVGSGQGAGHAAVFLGTALVIAYPYVWAACAAAGAWCTRDRWVRVGVASQLGCHAVGGGVLAVFGALLLAEGDSYVPRGAQVAALLYPPAAFLAAAAAARWARPKRRIPSVTVLGFVPHVVLNPLLAFHVARDAGPPWGYLLGGSGAFVGLAGSVGLWAIGGRGARDVHPDPDLQQRGDAA